MCALGEVNNDKLVWNVVLFECSGYTLGAGGHGHSIELEDHVEDLMRG